MDDLVDLDTVHIDIMLPIRERLIDYVKQIKDPYHYRIGGMEIIIQYTEGGPMPEDLLDAYLSGLLNM